jgi:hypothetical protein
MYEEDEDEYVDYNMGKTGPDQLPNPPKELHIPMDEEMYEEGMYEEGLYEEEDDMDEMDSLMEEDDEE